MKALFAQATTSGGSAALWPGGFSTLSLVLMALGLVLAVTWIVFPIIIISKCNQIARILGEIRDDVWAARAELKAVRTSKPAPAPIVAAPPNPHDSMPPLPSALFPKKGPGAFGDKPRR